MVSGADLASVVDDEENTFLYGEMTRLGYNRLMCGGYGFWIGAIAVNRYGKY